MRINQRNLKPSLPSGQEVLIRHSAFRIPHSAFRLHRPGFTLVELIIVIAIIAILAALTTGAVMRYYSVQQQTNTEVTIRKVYDHLKDQWDTVIRQAKDEQISPQAMAIAGGPGNEAQARVIHIKLRLKQEFPMDFNEILNPYQPPNGWDLPPLQAYKDAVATMLANAGITVNAFISTPRTITPTENATCLYLALQRSRGGASFNFDNLGSNAVSGDSSGYQKWIVDGWRTPIIYFRWATKNDELDRLNPASSTSTQASYRDPQDPTGALANSNWWSSNHNWPKTWTSFETQLHSLTQTNSSLPTPGSGWPVVMQSFPPPTPFTAGTGPLPGTTDANGNPVPYYVWAAEYYTVPVVASAGPNKNFGIVPSSLTLDPASGTYFSLPNPMLAIRPNDTTNYGPGYGVSGDDSDNIYSYRLRLGARGD